MPGDRLYRATFCRGTGPDDLLDQIHRLRKRLFVDQCGWNLRTEQGREIDQFDTGEALYAALFDADGLRGTFRATRTDRPYLAAEIFPQLAVISPYPRRGDMWEISRFGVLGDGDTRPVARIVYALMFRLARGLNAAGLVAIADLPYERFLRTLGIRTRRYGPPQIIGTDLKGRDLHAVAGEIPLSAQDPGRLAALQTLLDDVEITDASEVFGPARVSA